MEKFENGWFLSILRGSTLALPGKWFMFSPEDVPGLDLENMTIPESNTLNFKEARGLLRKAKIIANSDIMVDYGLPLVTVYTYHELE